MFRVRYTCADGQEYLADCEFTSWKDANGYAHLLMDTGRVVKAWVEVIS